MKVLVAHSFYRQPGGEDSYVRQQVEALSGHHDVELLERRNDDLSGGASTWAVMATGKAVQTEVDAMFDSFRPDVVHVHNTYPSLGPSIHQAAERRDIPLVMTVHNFRLRCPNGYMFTNGELCRRCEGGNYTNAVVHSCFETRAQAAGYASALWLHRFILKLEDKVTRFVAPSEFTAGRLRDWGIDDSRISVIHNFTNLPETVAPPGGFGLYLGRMSPEKGLDTLVDALAVAGDPDFVLAGDGPELAPLIERARALALDRTRFVGRRSRAEVAELTRDARYLVMSSRSEENAPLAALEAMAAGKPLIATSLGGLSELVTDGRGIAVAPADIADLAAAIRELCDDETRCAALGAAARAFAEANCTSEAHVAALTRCYEEVLGSRSSSS